MVQALKPKRRVKKEVPAMIPVKEWVSLDEACAYMDMSKNIFLAMALEKRLTVSIPTIKKKFYRVSELKQVFENSIAIKQF